MLPETGGTPIPARPAQATTAAAGARSCTRTSSAAVAATCTAALGISHPAAAEPVSQPALGRRRGRVAEGGHGHREARDRVRAGRLVQQQDGGQRHHALGQAGDQRSQGERTHPRPGEQGTEGRKRADGHEHLGRQSGTQQRADVALPGFCPFRCPPPGGSRRSDQARPQRAGGTLAASSRQREFISRRWAAGRPRRWRPDCRAASRAAGRWCRPGRTRGPPRTRAWPDRAHSRRTGPAS